MIRSKVGGADNTGRNVDRATLKSVLCLAMLWCDVRESGITRLAAAASYLGRVSLGRRATRHRHG